MKLYIWEGGDISSAYHDDGMLVVLAASPEQAREIVRNEKAAFKSNDDKRAALFEERQAGAALERAQVRAAGGYSTQLWQTDAGKAILAARADRDRALDEKAGVEVRDYWSGWDGSDTALDREPDRVIDLDQPAIVAFNGGGYD